MCLIFSIFFKKGLDNPCISLTLWLTLSLFITTKQAFFFRSNIDVVGYGLRSVRVEYDIPQRVSFYITIASDSSCI
jgi:hypothetical protein